MNQVINMRQIRDRSRAIAAQAAIIVSQAARAAKAVSALTAPGRTNLADLATGQARRAVSRSPR